MRESTFIIVCISAHYLNCVKASGTKRTMLKFSLRRPGQGKHIVKQAEEMLHKRGGLT